MTEPAPRPSASFEFNQPTVVSLLYLSSFVIGITAIIGLVLAYVWKSENRGGWEASHYHYHIRTFWIGLLAGIVSGLLIIVLIGFLGLVAVAIWVIIRTVLAMVAAQKHQPIADPQTLFW